MATFSVGTETNKKLFWFPVWGRTLNIYPQGPDGAEQGQFLATRRTGKRYNLGSEWSGEHLRYITQPWFQDDLGVVRPEFQASRVNGKGPFLRSRLALARGGPSNVPGLIHRPKSLLSGCVRDAKPRMEPFASAITGWVASEADPTEVLVKLLP